MGLKKIYHMPSTDRIAGKLLKLGKCIHSSHPVKYYNFPGDLTTDIKAFSIKGVVTDL